MPLFLKSFLAIQFVTDQWNGKIPFPGPCTMMEELHIACFLSAGKFWIFSMPLHCASLQMFGSATFTRSVQLSAWGPGQIWSKNASEQFSWVFCLWHAHAIALGKHCSRKLSFLKQFYWQLCSCWFAVWLSWQLCCSACQVDLLTDLAKSANRDQSDMHHELLFIKWMPHFHANLVSGSDVAASLPSWWLLALAGPKAASNWRSHLEAFEECWGVPKLSHSTCANNAMQTWLLSFTGTLTPHRNTNAKHSCNSSYLIRSDMLTWWPWLLVTHWWPCDG